MSRPPPRRSWRRAGPWSRRLPAITARRRESRARTRDPGGRRRPAPASAHRSRFFADCFKCGRCGEAGAVAEWDPARWSRTLSPPRCHPARREAVAEAEKRCLHRGTGGGGVMGQGGCPKQHSLDEDRAAAALLRQRAATAGYNQAHAIRHWTGKKATLIPLSAPWDAPSGLDWLGGSDDEGKIWSHWKGTHRWQTTAHWSPVRPDSSDIT